MGLREIEELDKLIGIVVIVGLLFLVAATMALALNSFRNSIPLTSNSSTSNFVYTSPETLAPVSSGITSLTATRLNQTWLEFDGVDDVIQVNNSNNYNFSGNGFTVMFWLNHSVPSGGVISKYLTTGDNREWSAIIDNVDGSRKINFKIRADGTSTEGLSIYSNSKDILTNNWNFIALDYNLSTANIYVNGVKTKSNSTFIDGVFFGSSNITIGNSNANTPNAFNGSIDNVRIYNVSLDTEQIFSQYMSSPLYNNNTVPVIYFHGINGTKYWDIQDVALFESMMDYINYSNYTTITTTQLKNLTLGEISVVKPIVLISDDGGKNLITNRSSYEKFGFNISLAISTIQADVGNSDYMNWSDLISLSNNGHEIIAHGYNHTVMTNYTYDERIVVFNNSKNYINSNISFMPSTFVFPKNIWNSTIMDECKEYYDICTADDGNGYFVLDNANLNNGQFKRSSIGNETTLLEFIDFLVKDRTSGIVDDTNLVLNLKFNENSGTTAYDSSGNSNDGTISGASWANDGIWVNLVSGVDYVLSVSTFKIINNVYSYSMIYIDYGYSTLEESQNAITNTIDAIKNIAIWLPILLIIIILGIVFAIVFKLIPYKNSGSTAEV